MNKSFLLAIFLLITLLGLIIGSYLLPTGPNLRIYTTSCLDYDFKCMIDRSIVLIKGREESIDFWIRLHLFLRTLLVVFGILSTVMIAVSDERKPWAKPIALMSSALATGITTAIIALHVPENVDKIAETVLSMKKATNEFGQSWYSIVDGNDTSQIISKFNSDKQFRMNVIKLSNDHANRMSQYETQMLKMYGTAAESNTSNQKPN